MSMFSGFTNQISGWVASKTGGGQPAAEDDPNTQLQQQVQGENGIDVVDESGEPQAAGGVAGFAKGLLQKGLTVKDNLKEKASSLNTQNLQGIGTNLMGGISSFMPGRKEEEVPTPPEDNPNTEEVMLEGDMQYLQQE